MQELNKLLKQENYVLNSQGGEIKGSEQELLEQSSTMAAEINWEFEEGTKTIPGCYMEFAKRYASSTGRLYQGFIAASATHLFDSTNKKSA